MTFAETRIELMIGNPSIISAQPVTDRLPPAWVSEPFWALSLKRRPCPHGLHSAMTKLEASASSGRAGAMGETTGHATGSGPCRLLL